MTQTDTDFWNLFQQARLLTPTQVKLARKRFVSETGGDSTETDPSSILAWMVGETWLTPFQANMLQQCHQSGQSASRFLYGPFVLNDDLQPPRYVGPHQYLARLTPEQADTTFRYARFVVRFAAGTNEDVWQKLRQLITPPAQPSPFLIQPTATYANDQFRALIEIPPGQDSQAVPELMASSPEPSLPLKSVLKIVGSLATGLSILHQQKRAAICLTPEQVWVSATGYACLRTIPDALLAEEMFAAKALGINFSEGEKKAVVGPQVITENAKPPQNLEYRKSLCRSAIAAEQGGWSTADYLAPEVMDGRVATGASDLYSLGCLLYFLATGRVPFPGNDWTTKRQARNTPLTLSDDLPKPIVKLLEALLTSDAQRRPNAEKVAASVWGILKKQPAAIPATSPDKRSSQASEWLELQDSPHFDSGMDDRPNGGDSLETPLIQVRGNATNVVGSLDISSDTTSEPKRWQKSAAKRSSWLLPAIWGSTAAVVILAFWVNSWWSGGETIDDSNLNNPDPSLAQATEAPPQLVATATGFWDQRSVKDDGQLLWESPTLGEPVQLTGLPANPILVAMIRGDFFQQTPTNDLFAAIRGLHEVRGSWQPWIDQWKLKDVDTIRVAEYQRQNSPLFVVHIAASKGITLPMAGWKVVGVLPGNADTAPTTSNTAEAELPAAEIELANDELSDDLANAGGLDQAATSASDEPAILEDATHTVALCRKLGDQTQVALVTATFAESAVIQDYATIPADRLQPELFDPEYAEGEWPAQAQIQSIVLANPEMAIESWKQPGTTELTLPLTDALECTDRDRHFQVICNPVSLWNEAGRTGLGDDRQWLCDLIKTQLPRETRALYLGAHLDAGQCYLETKFILDRTANPATVLSGIRRKLQLATPEVERAVLTVPRLAFWDTGLLKFDDMLQFLSSRIRSGQHNQVPTLNAWLPMEAPANLIAEMDLFFTATKYSSQTMVTANNAEAPPSDLSELLDRKRTLKIPEQDLVNALAELQTEVLSDNSDLPFEFAIELDGNSLQLEGITQNQKITDFEQSDQSLAEILTALVLKANPDKSVTSANDPKCKLIWLPHPEQEGHILISTRATATKNSWSLPPQVAESTGGDL